MTKPRVVCAMSGGVDSSVAAALLVERGFDVIGLFMRSGVSGHTAGEKQGCCSVEDAVDARRTADRLKIPFYALNMEAEFGKIIDHFVDSYGRGLTPNPCVLCNRLLKFGHVLAFAEKVGAEKVATGHYARLVRPAGPGERWTLARPLDAKKDQTYVLAVLSQAQLARTELPLGELAKAEVRALAAKLGLDRVAQKAESQEICFVPGDYRDLVRARLPLHAPATEPGEFRDTQGNILGHHEGVLGFTVGQRKKLGIALGERAYVVEVKPEERAVVLGPKEALLRRDLLARAVEWLARPPLAPGERVRGRAQIRAHHQARAATAIGLEDGTFAVILDEPEAGVAPGQLVVLYDEEDSRVLGSGWIERARPPASLVAGIAS